MVKKFGLTPFSLKEASSLIERVFPAQKISAEAFKERDAKQSQTLTGLGSYWKGRKPLVLARACILGAILPSTGDDERDLNMFEKLLGVADVSIDVRLKHELTVADIQEYGANPKRQRFSKR